jgi:hypothetical protein
MMLIMGFHILGLAALVWTFLVLCKLSYTGGTIYAIVFLIIVSMINLILMFYMGWLNSIWDYLAQII